MDITEMNVLEAADIIRMMEEIKAHPERMQIAMFDDSGELAYYPMNYLSQDSISDVCDTIVGALKLRKTAILSALRCSEC